ncbi:uncharacterized protein [Nicotiana sylvestris]|uniref:uncharacterized protein n=1 Tax=Nicotiana sylvestris TaxID=4096 RepID=UPI00388C7BD3
MSSSAAQREPQQPEHVQAQPQPQQQPEQQQPQQGQQPGGTANSSRRMIRRVGKSVPFIKFGPLFGQDDDPIKKAKEEAWQYVISSSKSREATITEIYISAIRRIEKEARASYHPESEVIAMSGKDFRDMMLKDSCLFLQLSFSLLRGDNKLDDFPHLRNSSFKLDDFPHLRNISLSNRHKWVESMFHVGNQIPLVVLRELLNQRYFREVIKNGKWKEPSSNNLGKMTLFRVLLSPAIERLRCCISVQFLPVSKHARRLKIWTNQLKECCDVLHGLHLLLLGPENYPEKDKYVDDDDDDDDVDPEEESKGAEDNDGIKSNTETGGSSTDVVAGKNTTTKKTDDDDTKVKNVAELKQAGIYFTTTKGGIRGITRRKRFLIYPYLFLPPLFVGSHTQFLLGCLKQYEEKLDPSEREVSSYLQFMCDLILTVRDAKLLESDGIIKGNRKYTAKLPTILKKLASNVKTSDENNLSHVKIDVNSYNRPPWVSEYFTIVFSVSFIGLIVSVAQVVYAILAYHKPPPNNK